MNMETTCGDYMVATLGLNCSFSNPKRVWARRTSRPAIVTIRRNKYYIRVLLLSFYTTNYRVGVLLRCWVNTS